MDARKHLSRSPVLCGLILWLAGPGKVLAQADGWTNPASGNWEDAASWSAGIPIATNQDIYITNTGWKAVAINPNTTQNFPKSLAVHSITISSPTNSFNTLLLNYAGTQTPLTAQTLTVASNSALTMFSSALDLNGPGGTGMSIGGEVDQNDSLVSGNAISVGNIGPGVYHLNSGTFSIADLFIEGTGVFNQSGGTNATAIVHLDSGEYVFSNGVLNAGIYFYGGTFRQRGGTIRMDASVSSGSYALEAGELDGNMVLRTSGYGNASALQAGGTNSGSLDIGDGGWGAYTISNGVLRAASLFDGVKGSFTQFDGQTTVTGTVSAAQGQISPGWYSYGTITLDGGTFAAAAMNIDGSYTQNGGTNIVGGDFTLYPDAHGFLTLAGGLLCDNNTSIGASWVGGYTQTGGVHIITNQLSLTGTTLAGWSGFTLSGGQLIVSNIALASLAKFTLLGGTISESGTVSVTNASLAFGAGSWQLGLMRLADTNSALTLLSNSCMLQFAASSALAWSGTASLAITNWRGSLYGGGAQRILFGNSTSGLTPQQVSQIQFQNPAGLPAGTYTAKILSTGEIVPNAGTPLPPLVGLSNQPGGVKLVSVQGDIGSNYVIQVSTDLLHWAAWTNRVNTNGVISILDTAATNYPARFYRAVLIP